MSLKQTKYGGICPLEKFTIDVPGGCGGYTCDPIEACIECNFADLSQEKFNLEKICKCPIDMTWKKYNELKEQYAKTEEEHTKKGFQKFVEENHKS